jgi:hypothetical protein
MEWVGLNWCYIPGWDCIDGFVHGVIEGVQERYHVQAFYILCTSAFKHKKEDEDRWRDRARV